MRLWGSTVWGQGGFGNTTVCWGLCWPNPVHFWKWNSTVKSFQWFLWERQAASGVFTWHSHYKGYFKAAYKSLVHLNKAQIGLLLSYSFCRLYKVEVNTTLSQPRNRCHICYKFSLGWTKTPVHMSGSSYPPHTWKMPVAEKFKMTILLLILIIFMSKMIFKPPPDLWYNWHSKMDKEGKDLYLLREILTSILMPV